MSQQSQELGCGAAVDFPIYVQVKVDGHQHFFGSIGCRTQRPIARLAAHTSHQARCVSGCDIAVAWSCYNSQQILDGIWRQAGRLEFSKQTLLTPSTRSAPPALATPTLLPALATRARYPALSTQPGVGWTA